jgi:hypothetical protein
MSGRDDGTSDERRAPARARKAERFERQARALRENLRRRNRLRRAGGVTTEESAADPTAESAPDQPHD